MKRILFFFAIIAILVSCGTAKSVSYTHKPLAAEGCTVSYSALQQDGQLQIIVTVKSDRLVFGDSPIMMLKNFKGEVLKLDGINLQSRSESSGVLINNIVVPITELSALAQFPVNKEDIPFFESGISKVRLSTVPIVHEKEFSTDVIGAYLLSALKKASSAEDDF
jgi:hypothetical protein